MRFIIYPLLAISFACTSSPDNNNDVLHSAAKRLNDSAVAIAMDSSDYEKAIELLDMAMQMDSNYLSAHQNKISFLSMVKPVDHDKQITVLRSLIRLRPHDPQYYMNSGLIYYKKGDSLSANSYFNDALIHYDAILDTMHANTKGYDALVIGKANTLFFIKREQEARDLLQKLNASTKDAVTVEIISPLLKKSREEIIGEYFEQ